ncbi:MAG: thioredoxin fold domain-containing protein [Pseudogulbenkiania sp.]|nr:thioredoxin fold domain-containing protein [Pseudogulbenkiania sp.]
MQLVCPACGARNRVPDERLFESPKCGKCAALLLAAAPLTLSDAALPGFLAGTGLPVLVDFWAGWCGPCQMMAPQFAAAAKARPTLRFVKLDTEQAPVAAQHYQIRSIPTLILFWQGRELARHSGVLQAAELLQWAERQLQAAGCPLR